MNMLSLCLLLQLWLVYNRDRIHQLLIIPYFSVSLLKNEYAVTDVYAPKDIAALILLKSSVCRTALNCINSYFRTLFKSKSAPLYSLSAISFIFTLRSFLPSWNNDKQCWNGYSSTYALTFQFYTVRTDSECRTDFCEAAIFHGVLNIPFRSVYLSLVYSVSVTVLMLLLEDCLAVIPDTFPVRYIKKKSAHLQLV